MTKNLYRNYDEVEAALNAVVEGKLYTEQSEVDAMAQAIEDAMAAAIEQALTKLEKKENNTVTPPGPNDPSKPNNPSASNEPSASGTGTENVQQAQVKTGDSNAVLPAIVLMILSGIGMSGIMVYYRKR